MNRKDENIFVGKISYERPIIDPFRSLILINKQPFDLLKLCEFNSNHNFKLCYRASEHGFGSKYFHSKCDGLSNTLTIFKASKTEFIFGGFTSAIWESCESGIFKLDPNAFLFSLTNKDNQPCKMNIEIDRNQYAIYCNSKFGPTFGDCDICLTDKASNTSIKFSSDLGNTYNHIQHAYGTNEAQSFLAGENNFDLMEIEVFKKE
jgi:protein sidekick